VIFVSFIICYNFKNTRKRNIATNCLNQHRTASLASKHVKQHRKTQNQVIRLLFY